MADKPETCRYCGAKRHPVEQCPRVASIEYEHAINAGLANQNIGEGCIKRIWFHPPQLPEVELTKAFFGNHDVRRSWRNWL